MSRISAIGSTTATAPLGGMQGRKLFRLETGTHAGRVVVLYRPSASEIALQWSDAPYNTWSAPLSVATGLADSDFAACKHPDGSFYIAYTQAVTLALICNKLSFDGELWTPLTERTIYDLDANYEPSLAFEEGADRIWVVWTRFDSGSSLYYIQNKRSLDDAVTWGTGSSDPGTALSDGASGCRAQILRRQDFMHCLYQDGGTAIRHRRYYINSVLWSDPEDVFTGSGFDDRFHASASDSGRLGLAVADGSTLRYREYDGDSWGTVATVASVDAKAPSVLFTGDTPAVLWGEAIGNGYVEWQSAVKGGSGFAISSLNAVRGHLLHVLLYSAAAPSPYADLTTAAGDVYGGDLVHPSTGNLFVQTEDTLYCGLDQPFDLLNLVLSAPGSGGAVMGEYWNGSIWQAFTPFSGAFDFTTSPARIRLFSDTWGTPSDWRMATVDGTQAYWIRVRVTSPFAAAPVGSQLVTTDTMVELRPLASIA